MHAFTFSLPTQIVFGPGTETETGKLIAGQGGTGCWWYMADRARCAVG